MSGKASTTTQRKCRLSKTKMKDIYYTCEWFSCQMVFDNEDSLYDHVLAHVQEVIDSAEGEGSESTAVCRWCHCAVELDSTYILRHLYYHAFHTKLMVRGDYLSKKNKWPRCHMDPSNRLVIPIIPGPFMCGWRYCDFQSNNVDVFYQHVATHPQEYRDSRYPAGTLPQCQWDDCKHITNRVDKLVDHLTSHTRKRVVACHLCGDMFVSSNALRDHLLRQTLRAPGDASSEHVSEHVCLQCGRVYASEKMLRDHLRLHVNVLKCEHCDMTCSSKYALKRHVLYKHTTTRAFPCERCTYSAKSSNDLLQHVQLNHEKTRPAMISCHYCGYACKHASTLIKHERLAHGPTQESRAFDGVRGAGADRLYVCHLCPRRFTSGKTLSAHLRCKHGLRLPPGFSKFTYRFCEDGLYRLQTTRIDSLEVIRQMVGPQEVARLLQSDAGEGAPAAMRVASAAVESTSTVTCDWPCPDLEAMDEDEEDASKGETAEPGTSTDLRAAEEPDTPDFPCLAKAPAVDVLQLPVTSPASDPGSAGP